MRKSDSTRTPESPPAPARAGTASERRRENFVRGSALLGCDDTGDQFAKTLTQIITKRRRPSAQSKS